MNMKANKKTRLKVLHLISGDLWAGAETMACTLLQRLYDYNDSLETSVILLNEGRLADEVRTIGINVQIIDENLNSFSQLVKKIRTLVVNKAPDIIHSHRYKENLLAFLGSRFSHNVRLISTQHGLPEIHVNKQGIFQRVISCANFFVLIRFFSTVAVSEDIRNVLVNRFGFRKDRIDVIHNGIQLPESVSVRHGVGPFVIGSSGRVFPVKDYPLMVKIAQTAIEMGAENIRFELAGDGPDMAGLQELVNAYGLNDHFIFRGHVNDMNSFYLNLDVYLNTSIHEGIPMTILEALVHSLPVIAPAVGGIVEIIDDEVDGFLINSREPKGFVDKCLLLKENGELRDKMKRAAREKAEKSFSAEMMAEHYYRLYQKLCN